MAFSNDEKQEIKDIVLETMTEQSDAVDYTEQVVEFAPGDEVPIVRNGDGTGEKSYARAPVSMFGGGGSSGVNGIKVGGSGEVLTPTSGVVTLPAYESGAEKNPVNYLKEAAISQDGNSLTIKDNNNQTKTFTPAGGGGSSVTPSDADPLEDGTKSAGTSASYSRGDHRHPHDSTKVDKVDGKGLSTNDYDNTAKTKVDAIPPNPKYTDTTYESKAAASGGTDVSLVTTGEKYTWNGKQDAISDLATIRNGASAGATAYQKPNDGIPSTDLAFKPATLGDDDKIPASQLPSYVDDVIEAANFDALPVTGEGGKIYVTLNNDKTYRWSGTAYVQIKGDIAIGTTAGTAADGKVVNDHITDTTKHITAAERTTWNGKQDALAFNTTPSSANKVATMNDIPSSLPANGGNAATVNNHTVGKDVPSDAVFTDHTYSVMGASGSTHASGLVPDTPSTAGTTKFLREDGKWMVPPSGGSASFDPIPTKDSTNGVTSGGTYSAIDNLTSVDKRIQKWIASGGDYDDTKYERWFTRDGFIVKKKVDDAPGFNRVLILTSDILPATITFDYEYNGTNTVPVYDSKRENMTYWNVDITSENIIGTISPGTGSVEISAVHYDRPYVGIYCNDMQNGTTLTITNTRIESKVIKLPNSDALYGEVYSEKVNEITERYYRLSESGRVGYIFITDMHFSGDNANNMAVLRQLQAVVDIANNSQVDFVCIGGDTVDNTSKNCSKDILIGYIWKMMRILSACKCPVAILAGNHDDNCYFTGGYSYGYVSKGFYARNLMVDNSIIPNMIMGGSKDFDCYYYFDIEKKNLRVVCLDFIDYNSNAAKTGGNWWGFSKEQVKWLCGTALNTDYNVIILSHGQIVDIRYGFYDLEDEGDKNWEASESAKINSSGTVQSGYVKAYYSGYTTDIKNAVTAFNNKTSITLYGITYDFSSRKGAIILSHHGHYHADLQLDIDGMPVILTDCAKHSSWPANSGNYTAVSGKTDVYKLANSTDAAAEHANGFNYEVTKATRGDYGTINECTFDVVSVNSSLVNIMRVGAGYDRTINRRSESLLFNDLDWSCHTKYNSNPVPKCLYGRCVGTFDFSKTSGKTIVGVKVNVKVVNNGRAQVGVVRGFGNIAQAGQTVTVSNFSNIIELQEVQITKTGVQTIMLNTPITLGATDWIGIGNIDIPISGQTFPVFWQMYGHNVCYVNGPQEPTIPNTFEDESGYSFGGCVGIDYIYGS